MRTEKTHIDQSSELTALQCEVSDLKAMMSVMQEIIMNQNKQISDIHKALFNNPIKSKSQVREQDKANLKAQILAKNISKR